MTCDNAGSTGNKWNVCQLWLHTNPDAIEWLRTHRGEAHELTVNASLAASGVVVTGNVYGDVYADVDKPAAKGFEP